MGLTTEPKSDGYQVNYAEFLTRGFLVSAWQDAIAHYTSDKPEEKMKHVIRDLWTVLFSSLLFHLGETE